MRLSPESALRSKVQRGGEVARVLREGGIPLAILGAVIRAAGDALACSAPHGEEDADTTFRLALVDDVVTLERQRWSPLSPPRGARQDARLEVVSALAGSPLLAVMVHVDCTRKLPLIRPSSTR